MSDVSTVTVLIPARNEEADIERCLRAVLAQDHPHDLMEVVMVDGGSADRTVELATRVLETGDIDWKIVENPIGTTPSNLNAGLSVATGEIICRVDARSIVPPEYVRVCAELLVSRPDVAVTGGAQIALALTDSPVSLGIARALNNQFVMGRSRYRSGAPSGPSDTVYLGAFRSEDLRFVGGWNETMLTNQDYELNRRMSRSGIVWYDSRLAVGYVPRQSLTDLWAQYQRFGRWKVKYWRFTRDSPQPRQLVPLLLVPSAALTWIALAVASTRHVLRLAVILLTAVASVMAVDAVGATTVDGPRARVIGVAASTIVVGGWVVGAYRELYSGRRRSACPVVRPFVGSG